MATHLPAELPVQVASDLCDDKPALAAASQVSNFWFPSFRCVLFKSIRFQGDATEGFERLAHFLESTPSVCPFILRLLLRGRINNPSLGKVISLLPSLSALSLEGAFETPNPITTTYPLFRLESLIIHVIWNDVDSGDVDLADVISDEGEDDDEVDPESTFGVGESDDEEGGSENDSSSDEVDDEDRQDLSGRKRAQALFAHSKALHRLRR